MRAIVRMGMEEGAWGLSSGTFYVPGSYAPPQEIQELAREVVPYGGAYTSHYRDESTYSVGLIAAGQDAHQGGLAGAVGPDQADALAGADMPRQAAEQHLGAVALLDVVDADHGNG